MITRNQCVAFTSDIPMLAENASCRKCFMSIVKSNMNCPGLFNCKRIHLNCKLVKFCSNSCLKMSSNHYNQLFLLYQVLEIYSWHILMNWLVIPHMSISLHLPQTMNSMCFAFYLLLAYTLCQALISSPLVDDLQYKTS